MDSSSSLSHISPVWSRSATLIVERGLSPSTHPRIRQRYVNGRSDMKNEWYYY